MEDSERIKVVVNEYGTVHVEFFYYRKWEFHAPASEVDNAGEVIEYIENLWPDLNNGSRLNVGWTKYRDRVHDEIKNALRR